MGSSPCWARSEARRPCAPRATYCRFQSSSTRSSICWSPWPARCTGAPTATISSTSWRLRQARGRRTRWSRPPPGRWGRPASTPALGANDAGAVATQSLPGLVASLLPIVLPVLLISSHTVVVSMTARPGLHLAMWSALAPYTAIIGNPNLALLVAVGIAMWVYARHRRVSRADLAEMVETSLMSAGVMILIIAASGAFGVALQATEIGSVIERAFVGQAAASGMGSGLVFLFLGFGVASLIKLAQGSSTVGMIQ